MKCLGGKSFVVADEIYQFDQQYGALYADISCPCLPVRGLDAITRAVLKKMIRHGGWILTF